MGRLHDCCQPLSSIFALYALNAETELTSDGPTQFNLLFRILLRLVEVGHELTKEPSTLCDRNEVDRTDSLAADRLF